MYTIELNEDGNYVMSELGYSVEGTWSVLGNKLILNTKGGTMGSYTDVMLKDGFLIFYGKTETNVPTYGNVLTETTLTLKKVVEETPDTEVSAE